MSATGGFMNRADRAKALEYHAMGHTQSRIAKALGTSRYKVKRVLLAEGVLKEELHPQDVQFWQRRKPELTEAIRGRVPISELARKYQVSRDEMELWLLRLGLRTNPGPARITKVALPVELHRAAEMMAADAGVDVAKYYERIITDNLRSRGVEA